MTPIVGKWYASARLHGFECFSDKKHFNCKCRKFSLTKKGVGSIILSGSYFVGARSRAWIILYEGALSIVTIDIQDDLEDRFQEIDEVL